MQPDELGARLLSARERRRLSQEEVAEVLGVSRVLVSHWERGQRRPSEQMLERLAQICGLSLRELLEGETQAPAQDLADLLFRDAETGSVDARARTGLQDFVRFLDAYADLLETLDHPFDGLSQSPFFLKRGFTSREDIRRKAEEVRDWLRLGLGPVGDLPGLLDSIGITVYRTALGSDLNRSISGAFLLHPKLGMCVAVNIETTPGRQIFTMAHELAHALYHSHDEVRIVSYWQRRDEKERIADIWAGEFLVPLEGLRRATEAIGVKSVTTPEEVVRIQRFFGVSYGMMLVRLVQARMLDQETYEALKSARPVGLARRLGYEIQDEEIDQDPSRWRLERFPRRFVRVLTNALRDERISPPTAAALTQLTIDEVSELIAPPTGGDPSVIEELDQYGDVRQRAAG